MPRPPDGGTRWVVAAALACGAVIPTTAAGSTPTPATAATVVQGIFRLDHLIFVVQENRSFDHSFGT